MKTYMHEVWSEYNIDCVSENFMRFFFFLRDVREEKESVAQKTSKVIQGV
jgi:hypothetical protein